jgi:hypothetical protein
MKHEVRRIEIDGTSGMQAEAQSVSRTKFQVSTFNYFLYIVCIQRIMAFWNTMVKSRSSIISVYGSCPSPSTGVVAMAMRSHCAVKID